MMTQAPPVTKAVAAAVTSRWRQSCVTQEIRSGPSGPALLKRDQKVQHCFDASQKYYSLKNTAR
jgi:hypothetical protein